MNAGIRLAVWLFICLVCDGDYRQYRIFVRQKEKLVLTKTHYQS